MKNKETFLKQLVDKKDIHGNIITKERAVTIYNELIEAGKKLDELGTWDISKDIMKSLKKGQEYKIWEKNEK